MTSLKNDLRINLSADHWLPALACPARGTGNRLLLSEMASSTACRPTRPRPVTIKNTQDRGKSSLLRCRDRGQHGFGVIIIITELVIESWKFKLAHWPILWTYYTEHTNYRWVTGVAMHQGQGHGQWFSRSRTRPDLFRSKGQGHDFFVLEPSSRSRTSVLEDRIPDYDSKKVGVMFAYLTVLLQF